MVGHSESTADVAAMAPWLSRCELCPRRCGADRLAGERGVCGADASLRVARAALHVWEEPLISVGAGSGAVFFSNCPLHCIYCQNIDIAHGAHGTDIAVERLAEIFAELEAQGAANINLVTPTQYWPHIAAARRLFEQRGPRSRIPFVCNTSGYESDRVIRDFSDCVEVYLTDFKYDSPALSDEAERYSHAADYFEVATAALDAMADCAGEPATESFAGGERLVRGVIVRHLLLPGRLEDSKRVVEHLWSRYGDAVLYSAMGQYTPVRSLPRAPELDGRVDAREYERLLDFMDSLGMEDYFWQQGGADQASFIPTFDSTGVLPANEK